MVEILRGQRDRFRTKVHELENMAQGLRQQVAEAQAKSSKVTQDNVKLYEKVR